MPNIRTAMNRGAVDLVYQADRHVGRRGLASTAERRRCSACMRLRFAPKARSTSGRDSVAMCQNWIMTVRTTGKSHRGMYRQRHTRRKREAKSQFNAALPQLFWHTVAGRREFVGVRGRCDVRTVARVRPCGSIRAPNRRRSAAPSQPEFCHSRPGSEFWTCGHSPKRRCARCTTWTSCWRGRARGGCPPGSEHPLYRHTGWRHLEDDEWRNDLDAAHRQAGIALDFESRLRSHRSHPFDRGHGPHR